jgi:transketolase
LSSKANQLRSEAIRLSKANGGYHFGGSFSPAELLVDLYFEILTDEDKFILSKGHGCWVYYAILRELGYNPRLEGHPHRDPQNGIHSTTGSMGHGLPTAMGIAFAMKNRKDGGRCFVIMGDGECQEGTTWESLLIAPKLGLDNLVAIIDNNGIQGSGRTTEILNVIPAVIAAASAAGWEVQEVDGHASELPGVVSAKRKRPLLVVANTIKGKGVSFMEDDPNWHSQWLTDELELIAHEELGGK